MNIKIPKKPSDKLSIPEEKKTYNCILLIAVSHYNLNADYDHESERIKGKAQKQNDGKIISY